MSCEEREAPPERMDGRMDGSAAELKSPSSAAMAMARTTREIERRISPRTKLDGGWEIGRASYIFTRRTEETDRIEVARITKHGSWVLKGTKSL